MSTITIIIADLNAYDCDDHNDDAYDCDNSDHEAYENKL